MNTLPSCPSSRLCDTFAPSNRSLTLFWRSGLRFICFFSLWSLCVLRTRIEKSFCEFALFWKAFCFFRFFPLAFLGVVLCDSNVIQTSLTFWPFCLSPKGFFMDFHLSFLIVICVWSWFFVWNVMNYFFWLILDAVLDFQHCDGQLLLARRHVQKVSYWLAQLLVWPKLTAGMVCLWH